MNFALFILFSILIFICSLVGGRKYRSTTLYALAIGGVVNANFFHTGNHPINCFGLPFGIDSIIYTLFIFCVIVMLLKQDKKSAYLLAISSIVAIMFSALMQFVAESLSAGFSWQSGLTFLNFSVSSLASVIAIVVAIEIINKLKHKTNCYVNMLLGTVIASIIDSCIYFPITLLINGTPTNILIQLLTSLIGKGIAIACSLLALWLMNLCDKKSIKKQNN